ncbi:MAG: Mth938-like domain-containing protein [Actinomycetota bacterium]
MDITPLIPSGRQLIQAYGDGGFRIAGQRWEGSVLVLPDRTAAWPVASLAELTEASLAAVVEAGVQVLLLGCGKSIGAVPRELKASLRAAGIVVDPMDTGAACRTFNVLLAEDRKVAAALIAV